VSHSKQSIQHYPLLAIVHLVIALLIVIAMMRVEAYVAGTSSLSSIIGDAAIIILIMLSSPKVRIQAFPRSLCIYSHWVDIAPIKIKAHNITAIRVEWNNGYSRSLRFPVVLRYAMNIISYFRNLLRNALGGRRRLLYGMSEQALCIEVGDVEYIVDCPNAEKEASMLRSFFDL